MGGTIFEGLPLGEGLKDDDDNDDDTEDDLFRNSFCMARTFVLLNEFSTPGSEALRIGIFLDVTTDCGLAVVFGVFCVLTDIGFVFATEIADVCWSVADVDGCCDIDRTTSVGTPSTTVSVSASICSETFSVVESTKTAVLSADCCTSTATVSSVRIVSSMTDAIRSVATVFVVSFWCCNVSCSTTSTSTLGDSIGSAEDIIATVVYSDATGDTSVSERICSDTKFGSGDNISLFTELDDVIAVIEVSVSKEFGSGTELNAGGNISVITGSSSVGIEALSCVSWSV